MSVLPAYVHAFACPWNQILEGKLQIIISCHVDAENQAQVFWKGSKSSYLMSHHLSSPSKSLKKQFYLWMGLMEQTSELSPVPLLLFISPVSKHSMQGSRFWQSLQAKVLKKILCIWRSEDNFVGLVISYIYEALKIKLMSSGLGSKHLTNSHFMGPWPRKSIYLFY